MSFMTDFKSLKESALTSGITAAATGLVTLGIMTSAVASRTDPDRSNFSPNTLKNIVLTCVPLITFSVLSSRIKNWNLN